MLKNLDKLPLLYTKNSKILGNQLIQLRLKIKNLKNYSLLLLELIEMTFFVVAKILENKIKIEYLN